MKTYGAYVENVELSSGETISDVLKWVMEKNPKAKEIKSCFKDCPYKNQVDHRINRQGEIIRYYEKKQKMSTAQLNVCTLVILWRYEGSWYLEKKDLLTLTKTAVLLHGHITVI